MPFVKGHDGSASFKHGAASRSGLTPTYRIWRDMKSRCSNPNRKDYRYYGGRGIKVCERWLEFSNFLADMGERPEGLTLERKDNNLGYSKENCRWATRAEQNLNSRNNRNITYAGKTLCIRQWALNLGIREATIRNRLDRLGWSIDRTLTQGRV
jgi:hypothetical protein